MYQSKIYLEVRVLLSAVPGVFIPQSSSEGKRDILTAEANFVNKNNSRSSVNGISIQPAALRKVITLINALGGTVAKNNPLERLTGNIQEPPDDRNFTGYSVKAGYGGSLNIMFHQKSKRINIEEYRIEEDCGRLTRTNGSKAKMDWTYSGCPSLRLRTSASFEIGEEAEIFLQEFYTLLTYLKLTPTELAESSVRCNAYVSMSKYSSSAGAEVASGCVKLRNLNSFNFVRKAINSELSREEEILMTGGTVAGESRLWVQELDSTQSWKHRDESVKRFEVVQDGLLVEISSADDNYASHIELPAVRRDRLRRQYGFSRLRAQFICGQKDRADYFETAVAEGAEPMLAAHWMASEVARILNQSNTSIRQSRLTPQKFAEVMIMLSQGRIHSGMAKTLLQTISRTGEKPDTIIKRSKMVLLSTREEIEPYVEKVLDQNEKSVAALKRGDMAPLEFLTGAVMKETGGQALPTLVKSIIKDKLEISIIYMFTMGGAISARRQEDGTIAAGNPEALRSLLNEQNSSFPAVISPVSDMLSEETEPADWARLVVEIKKRIESGTANGIVVTHGTDTLSYTASLLFWLFNASDVPIVITASSTLPDYEDRNDESRINLNLAVKLASEKKRGVYVVYGGKVFSPLNLKYISTGNNGFVNWNLDAPLYESAGTISQQFLSVSAPEEEIVTYLMNEASRGLQVIHLYPGLQTCRLERLMTQETGVNNVILELYGSGTANMRNTDYSIKSLLLKGRKLGYRVYCTSQQESKVDFAEYSTGADAWREGAVPMGALTTESVVALYFAAYIIADSEAELDELMETAAESVGLN